jgi:arylsulfatase
LSFVPVECFFEWRAIKGARAFNVGIDTGTPVDDKDYQVPFPFAGKIDKLTVKLGPKEM